MTDLIAFRIEPTPGQSTVDVIGPDGQVWSRSKPGGHVRAIAARYEQAYLLGWRNCEAQYKRTGYARLCGDQARLIHRLERKLGESANGDWE